MILLGSSTRGSRVGISVRDRPQRGGHLATWSSIVQRSLTVAQARSSISSLAPISRDAWLAPALLTIGALCMISRVLITLTRWDGYEIAKFFFADDAFYYLKIAQNIVRGRGSTFDGVFPTNGYHPLWELVCVLMHAVWPRPGAPMVSLVYVTQVGLLLTAAGFLFAGLRTEEHARAAALAVLLLALNTISGLVLIDGMESGLSFTLLAVFAYLAGVRAERFFDLRRGHYALGMFALLLALALVRLEAALFGAMFLACALAEGWRRARRRQLRNAGLVATGLLASGGLYMLLNLTLVGLPVPISGLVKALWPSRPGQITRLLSVELSWFVGPLRLQQAFERPSVLLVLSAGLGAGLVFFLRGARAGKQPGLLLVALGCVLLMGHNVLLTRQAFHWYGWPALMLGTLASFGLLARASDWLPHTRSAAAAILCFALGYGGATTYRAATRDYVQLYDWNTSPRSMDAALRFVREQIPRMVGLGGDSVGLVAYMSGRDIMNVEGLVADRAYYDALKRGANGDVLRARGIAWLLATQAHRYAPRCASTQAYPLSEQADGSTPPEYVRFQRLDYAGCEPAR
jgi:hypothetical protein